MDRAVDPRGTPRRSYPPEERAKLGHGDAVDARTPNQDRQITSERNGREAAVIRDAERALDQARREGDEIIAAAERRPAKMQSAAEGKPRTIIREAEEKAGEPVDAAELDVADAKLLAAREREAAAMTRDELRGRCSTSSPKRRARPPLGLSNFDTH